jgi:hypothetical protein
VLTESIKSRPKPRRRAVSDVKITYKVFTQNIATNSVGERSAALENANIPTSRLFAKRFGVVASASALALVVCASCYFVFCSFTQSNAQLPSSESPASTKTEPCLFSLSETQINSRSKASFGGIIVETGAIECGGQDFIVTQTANADGRVLSVKKKRA